MSKFMLSAGFVLASLIGLAGTAQAQRPRPGQLPVPTAPAPVPLQEGDQVVGDHWNYEQAQNSARAFIEEGQWTTVFVEYHRDTDEWYVHLKR